MSGGTTACFGISFALVILSRLHKRQTDSFARLEIEQSIDREIQLIRSMIEERFKVVNEPRLESSIETIAEARREILIKHKKLIEEELAHSQELRKDPFDEARRNRATMRLAAAYIEFKGDIAKSLNRLQAAQVDLSGVVPQADNDAAWWLNLRATWRVFDDSIRPKAESMGIPLPHLDALRSYLTLTESPLSGITVMAFTELPAYVQYWKRSVAKTGIKRTNAPDVNLAARNEAISNLSKIRKELAQLGAPG